MKNIEYQVGSEGNKAVEAIFNACRANPNREAKGNVTFRSLVNGNHEAALRDADGIVIALAEVDEFDV